MNQKSLQTSQMVLQDASATSTDDSFKDSAPNSDDDPYASSNATKYKINSDGFPQPIPILGAWLGYDAQLLAKITTQKIAHGSQILRRPMTQEEVDGLAYWAAKQISIYSYSKPLGVAAGAWRCYTTADSFRFPFYKPNPEKFNTQAFPPVFKILTGSRAVAAWHGLRFLAYGGLGQLLSQMLLGSYSMTVGSVGELGDKRLKSYIEAIRADAERKRGALMGGQGRAGMGQPQPQAGAGIGGLPQGNASSKVTVGGESDWNTTPNEEPREGSIEGSRASMQASTPSVTSPTPTSRPRGSGRPVPAQNPVEESSPQPFGMFDDASPTGGQGVQADIRAAPAASQGGSAWDRIRRGESLNKSTDPGTRTAWQKREDARERTSGDNSFAFSKSEGEKSFAREEAQKEFDARVERERRGGDFSKGSGDQRRW